MVFDGWLETLGGGERQVLAAAAALREMGSVTVVSHRAIEWRDVVERAGLDLDQVRYRRVPETPQLTGDDLVPGCDLLVNGTHHSLVHAGGVPAIRFVYFPARRCVRWIEVSGNLVRRVGLMLGAARESTGWYGAECSVAGRYRHSDGSGHISVGGGGAVRFWLSAMGDGGREYTVVSAKGEQLGHGVAGTGGDFCPSPWIEIGNDVADVVLKSRATLFNSDGESRSVGIALGSIEEKGSLLRAGFQLLTRRIVPLLGMWSADEYSRLYARALGTYDVVTPNSRYTASWLERRWGISGPVIEPPVISGGGLSGPKAPLIVSIGRFFSGGHNKKHLEMVRAFENLCADGLVGWRLVLVGGVGQRPEDHAYFCEVERAARGSPIDLFPDADEQTVCDLRDRAALGWHATGYGESGTDHPERFEHFGMAIAELMAAGAVPIVFDGGGLREIVEHERNGYRWRTLDELCEYTMSLVRNGRRRVRFAAAAQQRAELWSLGHYQRRILAMTRDLIASRKQRLIAR